MPELAALTSVNERSVRVYVASEADTFRKIAPPNPLIDPLWMSSQSLNAAEVIVILLVDSRLSEKTVPLPPLRDIVLKKHGKTCSVPSSSVTVRGSMEKDPDVETLRRGASKRWKSSKTTATRVRVPLDASITGHEVGDAEDEESLSHVRLRSPELVTSIAGKVVGRVREISRCSNTT